MNVVPLVKRRRPKKGRPNILGGDKDARAFTVRLPEELKKEIIEAAENNGRSIGAEIRFRLGYKGKQVY